jgi:hypothetical protein
VLDPLNAAIAAANATQIGTTDVFLEHSAGNTNGTRVIRERETYLGGLVSDAFVGEPDLSRWLVHISCESTAAGLVPCHGHGGRRGRQRGTVHGEGGRHGNLRAVPRRKGGAQQRVGQRRRLAGRLPDPRQPARVDHVRCRALATLANLL